MRCLWAFCYSIRSPVTVQLATARWKPKRTYREFGRRGEDAATTASCSAESGDARNAEGMALLHVALDLFHGDEVTPQRRPPASSSWHLTEPCPVAGAADEAQRFYAVQFHSEVTHTTNAGPRDSE